MEYGLKRSGVLCVPVVIYHAISGHFFFPANTHVAERNQKLENYSDLGHLADACTCST